jgi:carbon monoxide dehydrogenase subunit G
VGRGYPPAVVRIELTQEIARPVADVFALLADLDRLPEWQASAVESRAEGELAEGTRIRERRRVMGRELESELEVVAYDPPRRLTLKALSGPVRFTVDHQLTESGEGTVLRLVAKGKAGGFMKFGEPLLARKAEEEMRADLERLKGLLESGGYPSGDAPVD